MPQYTLILTHTPWGNGNPNPMANRRKRAIKVANRNGISGWSGTPVKDSDITDNKDGTITWKVQGDSNDVLDMLAIWARHRNVTVTGGPP